jgi:hypothetical protein
MGGAKIMSKKSDEHLRFDPDIFVLTKNDVLKILDRIEARWKKNQTANLPLLMELKGAKFYFRIKSDEAIQRLWGEILNEFNEIIIENNIKQNEINNETNLQVFKKIRDSKK